MNKRLFVSSPVQVALLKNVLIPEMATGFWKDHRPADHAAQWTDVEIIVSQDSKLGPVDFNVPRLYNFVNPDFIKPNEQLLVAAAQAVKSTSNFRSVKKELIELSRIVGGRLTDANENPTKANRGNNKNGSVQEPTAKTKTAVKKATTAVKKTISKKESGVVTETTSNGATVRRVAVTKASPFDALTGPQTAPEN
ncbi:hypothetical protein [Acinetobacter sp.]|uniref:hypothetical protein n=1 Tax=Acinetobacter sp. TaxID=472 RepID=UPI0038900665